MRQTPRIMARPQQGKKTGGSHLCSGWVGHRCSYAAIRGAVRGETAPPPLKLLLVEAEYYRQNHNARKDNQAVQLPKLQCALPLNQS
jgi:hypothetical protein